MANHLCLRVDRELGPAIREVHLPLERFPSYSFGLGGCDWTRMSSLLGIDLGTFSVKAVVFAADGTLKGVGMAEYPILTPRLGYAEQDPEKWWRATIIAVREALEKAGRPQILGIGFSGQMHGLVLLDQRKSMKELE